jgi:hypothetical protein
VLQWEPSVSLEEGLAVTYHWIADQLAQQVDHPPLAQATQIPTSV